MFHSLWCLEAQRKGMAITMDELPLISVITTVYNTEKYVERCFDSVMEQTYPNIEFIVVDNGSDGNIHEIITQYQNAYSNRIIKEVVLEENIGLFHGRLAGATQAQGDYIAFIDSDDRISLDYYRVLVSLAEDKNADIVASDVVLEFDDGNKLYENLNPFHFMEFDLHGDELRDSFWKQEGACYYWHLVWNKIYSSALIAKAIPYLKMLADKVVMCDDMAYSTTIYMLAEHFVSTNSVCYLYYKRQGAYTVVNSSIDIYLSNINNVVSVLQYMEKIIFQMGLIQYRKNHVAWKSRYFRIWRRNIAQSPLKNSQKKYLVTYLEDRFCVDTKCSIKEIDREDNFFYQKSTPFYEFTDEYIRLMQEQNVEVISFDIFDTLVKRPLLDPTDLFAFINPLFQELLNLQTAVDFKRIRENSERLARIEQNRLHGYEEVKLTEIYKKMQEIYGFSEKICIELMNKEIELEKQFIERREFAYQIYSVAVQLKKRIICISDMYLDEDDIWDILHKCGYDKIERIFLSSKYRTTKHIGKLFDIALNELHLAPNQILHIGDNYHSDIQIPEKKKIEAVHIPKIKDVWLSTEPTFLNSTFFSRCFHDSELVTGQGCLMYLGTRCAHALAANRIFDQPYRQTDSSMDINLDPYAFGYEILGPFLYGLVDWLYKRIAERSYSKIHFIARDGYLIEKVFNLMQSKLGTRKIETNYLVVSRKAMIPLMIQRKMDLYALENVVRYTNITPQKLLELLKPIIPQDKFENAEKICEKRDVLYSICFENESEYLGFLKLYQDEFYDQKMIAEYRNTMKRYFESIIGDNECFFDVGYTGRTESLLINLLTKRIDTFYLNTTTQLIEENSRLNGFSVQAFYNFLPVLSGPIREMLLSAPASSCIGYDISGNSVRPIYEQSDRIGYAQRFIISCVQEGALEYIKKYIDTFGDHIKNMPVRNYDLAKPFEYFLQHAQPNDLQMFSSKKFEDDLFLGETVFLNEYWINNTLQSRGKIVLDYSTETHGIKKFIILLLADRKRLKELVTNKISDRPIILKLMRLGYRTLRRLYRAIRRDSKE